MNSRGRNKSRELDISHLINMDEKEMRGVRVFQILAVLLLFIFIATLMHEPVSVDVPLSSVETKILGYYEDYGGLSMVKSGSMKVKRSYGLNTADYTEFLYYEPETNMDVDEVLIIHLKETSQAEAVIQAMEKRIEIQKKNFDGYGTVQLDTLKDAIVYSNDSYVCLVISKRSRELLKTIRSVLEA